MRPIDADAILDKKYHAYPSIDHYCTSRTVVDAKDIIDAPTVDGVNVFHKMQDYCINRGSCSGCRFHHNGDCVARYFINVLIDGNTYGTYGSPAEWNIEDIMKELNNELD